jgi:lambda family phage tail tape measure protein
MDLAQLKFVVDTKDLEKASTIIKQLATEVGSLNKPMQDVTKASSEMNKQQAASEKATSKVAETTKSTASVLERQQAILEFMTQGFSKGQSTVLAYAQSLGVGTSELSKLGEVLKTQRTLMGTDPFDKSIGAVQSWTNKLNAATEAQSLYNQGIRLSYAQLEELGREKVRIIEKFKIEGKTVADAEQEYKKLIATAAQLENTRQGIIGSMNASEKATKDAAKAQAYLAQENERVSRLVEDGGEITSATNNKLLKYEAALKATGMSAKQQTAALEAYKKQLLDIQKVSGNRQVDYLSRALGPQITDIFVGLATGQSPMMVLLQQGGQLRDQFALAGVAGKDMGNMLTEAAKSMVVSIKDVAVAVGGLLVNAFTSAGSAIVTSMLAPFKALSEGVSGIVSGSMTASQALSGLTTSFVGLMKTGIVAVIAGLALLAMEYVKITQTTTALNQAIALTGGGFGMTVTQAKAFAESMATAGGSTLKFMGILTEFAKVGQAPTESMVKLASDIDKYLGQSVQDTVKQYDKLKEDPVNALVELAKQTGFVNKETLMQVYNLEKVGNRTKAAEVAQRAYEEALKQSVAMAKANLDPLQKLWIDIKSAISGAMDELYRIATSETVVNIATNAFKGFATVVSSVWYSIKQIVNGFGALGAALVKFFQGDYSGAAGEITTFMEENKAATQEQVKYLNDLWKAKEENVKVDTSARESNVKYAESFKTVTQGIELYQRLLDQAERSQNEAARGTQFLTKAQADLATLMQSEDWKKLNAAQRQQLTLVYQRTEAIEREKQAMEGQIKAREFLAEITGEAAKMGSQFYANMEKLNLAQLELGLDPQQYADLANEIYKLTNSYKALAAARIATTKDVADIEAARQSIRDQYSMDFQLPNQKAAILAESKLRRETAAADAEYAKTLVDAYRTMNYADYLQSIPLYTEKYEKKKQLAQDAYDREIYLLSDAFKRQEAYGQAFQNLFSGMADAIVNFAKTGKLSFGDLITNMITDLVRFELRLQTLKMYESMGGSSGIIKGVKSLFGFADGGAFNGGVQAFAKGGTFTNSIVSQPTLFKFAKGTGLMGEAGPEAIMPLTRGSDGSLGVRAQGTGSNVSVQVINNTNAMASTSETVDSKGNRKVEVVIGDMTAGEISRSGSASQKSIRSTFGIQPQLIRR